MRSCGHCGSPLSDGSTKRARYCSPACKDAAAARRRRIDADRELAQRPCRRCGKPLDNRQTRKALTCSVECSVAWSNESRAQEREARRLAALGPCERCGGPIPSDRKAATKYCSFDCKRLAHGEMYRLRHKFRTKERIYGLDKGGYEALLEEQGGRCAICRGDWNGKDSSPSVDHDHVTGVTRGLLCNSCNNGLGRFKDDPARLRAAAEYLERALTAD